MMHYKAIRFTCFLMFYLGSGCLTKLSGQSNCDPDLVRRSNKPLGYKERVTGAKEFT
jgi:hypothetical protein